MQCSLRHQNPKARWIHLMLHSWTDVQFCEPCSDRPHLSARFVSKLLQARLDVLLHIIEAEFCGEDASGAFFLMTVSWRPSLCTWHLHRAWCTITPDSAQSSWRTSAVKRRTCFSKNTCSSPWFHTEEHKQTQMSTRTRDVFEMVCLWATYFSLQFTTTEVTWLNVC